MKRAFILLYFFILAFTSKAVEPQTNQPIIPDEYTHSVDSLALYLECNCDTEEEKLKTLYIWMTHTFRYRMFEAFVAGNQREGEEKEIQVLLDKRTGVCRDFSLLFKYVAQAMDIPAFFVEAYTKDSQGYIQREAHAWNVAKVNGKWYNYDTTYGMGYARNNEFVSRPTMEQYMVPSSEFMKTHMPFDPIWQLDEHPMTYQAFDQPAEHGKEVYQPLFNYNDSIIAYSKQNMYQQSLALQDRILHNGTANALVQYLLDVNGSNIKVHHHNVVYESYKESMKYYSQGWDEMKLFNRYKLANYRPKKNVLEVKAWLDSAQANYEKAKQVMAGVSNPPETISKAVGNLNRYIDELHTLIDQQWAAFNEHYKKELKKLKK